MILIGLKVVCQAGDNSPRVRLESNYTSDQVPGRAPGINVCRTKGGVSRSQGEHPGYVCNAPRGGSMNRCNAPRTGASHQGEVMDGRVETLQRVSTAHDNRDVAMQRLYQSGRG